MDKWSFIFGLIGVLALLLAIPLSIIANLITPKIKDWWATTSDHRRETRIAKLQLAVTEIGVFRSAEFRQEMFLFGVRWLVTGLLSMTSLIFMVFSDVLFLSASLDHALPIFPFLGFHITLPVVVLYRYEAVMSLVIVLLTLYSFRQARQRFQQSSRLYARRKLEEATKELRLLKNYFGDNSTPPTIDKP